MATSTIPAAIAGLLATLRAAPGLAGVVVHDGPPVTAETPDWVAVGYDPTDPLTSVDASQVPASLGNRGREESYDILCSLASRSGDEDMAPRRARAMEMFAAVEAAVRADVTLGGAVRTAQIASYSLTQEQTRQGASAGVSFRIACSARLS
jgi:hypothetical protein